MKFCRLIYYVFIVQFINSCIADSVTKTEAPANSAGNAIIDTLNNDTLAHQDTEPVTTNTIAVDSLPTETFTESSAEISENVGQASQIQSSFEEVPKLKAPIDEVAINDKLPGVLNQGTLSQDVADTGTIGVVSLSDTASADLHQLASSASADINIESKSDQTDPSNATAGSLTPIVVLPSGEPDPSTGQSPEKPESTPSPQPPIIDQPQPPVIRAEPKIVEQNTVKAEEKLDQGIVQNEPPTPLQDSQNSAKPSEAASPPPSQTGSPLDLVTVPSSEIPQEEIPSFSEWTQKQLEEAEKKKGQNKTASPPISRGPAPSKMRSKNYASPDCGAKIVATNPEAENPSGVLANSKDEYLINRCSTQRMWVIIELCEPVQAKKIELANFELFSSSPKDFSVYLGHTFPSRDWSSVGQFTAKDERTVQSFNLHPHLFGKFLKVEFNSHYGKEHFCCTSLIRVYGTSEFEVLETENEVHSADHDDEDEDEDEQPIGADTGKPAKNLFGHATDAVYTIVRKAAEVLVKSSDSQNQSKTLETKNNTALIPAYRVRPRYCNTLRHLVVCNNCSEDFFDRVYHLLSCQSSELQALIESPFVFDGINNSQLCSLYGLDFIEKRNLALPLRLRHEDQLDQAGYLAAMLPAEYISALCNILAILEGKVVLNNSQAALAYQGATLSSTAEDTHDSEFTKLLIEHQPAQTCSKDASVTLSHCQPAMPRSSVEQSVGVTSFPGNQPGSSLPSLASEIKPTRTLTKEEAKGMSVQDGSAQQVPVQKSGTPPDVTATMNMPINMNVEPSAILVSMNVPGESIDNIKLSSAPPETTQETVIPEQPVLEVPPLDRERDLGDSSFVLDSGTSEDQDSTKDLDAIFMEMKALDNNEETSTETSGSASTPSSVITQTRVPTGQAQKESVFLRLSNKIKALERNMSLSGQYLEELSRRYKKQEELSRALNKTIVLLREEIRKSKDREQQRDSDLHFLRTQLIQVTAAIESYQSERDSWQHKAVVMSQHFILIMIEVVMFGIVVWMCRRIPSDTVMPSATAPQRKWSTGWRKGNKSHVKHLRRRSSLDDLSSSTDLRKRRPSEEALKISGSYKDLMLREENVIIVEGEDLSTAGDDSNSWLAVSNSRDQRRKRKRRKDGLVRSSSSNNLQVINSQTITRKISAPLHSYSVPADSCESDKTNMQFQHTDAFAVPVRTEKETCISEAAFVPACSPYSGENGSTSCDTSKIPATFMETATSTRHRRSFNLVEAQLPFHAPATQDWKNHVEGDSGSSASGQSSRSKGLDSLEPVGNSSLGDSPAVVYGDKKKKLNKKGGLKNMVKKFF